MTTPLEFSCFFRLLNSVKQGKEEDKDALDDLLKEYKESKKPASPLHELAQIFLYVGVTELFEYAGSKDLKYIGSLSKSDWEDLAEKQKGELPPHIANTMISHAKNQKLSEEISKKWNSKKREIDQNIMQMARYITEGIIDAIE